MAAFLASLTIALREGLEVALLIAALLAFLRKSGQGHLARLVHMGWMLAVPAGFLTFVAVGALVSGQRELAEGMMTLLAAAILITMTHWIIGAKEARHWLGFCVAESRGAGEQAALSQKLALLGLSFLRSIARRWKLCCSIARCWSVLGPQGRSDVIWGAVVGVVVMFAVVLIVGRIGRKAQSAPGHVGQQCAAGAVGTGDDGQWRACAARRRLRRATLIHAFGKEWGGVPVRGFIQRGKWCFRGVWWRCFWSCRL